MNEDTRANATDTHLGFEMSKPMRHRHGVPSAIQYVSSSTDESGTIRSYMDEVTNLIMRLTNNLNDINSNLLGEVPSVEELMAHEESGETTGSYLPAGDLRCYLKTQQAYLRGMIVLTDNMKHQL